MTNGIEGSVAIVTGGLFAGAAVYVNLVEHPARVECGVEIAVAQFGPSYRRGAVMQASLALVAMAAGAGAWAMGGDLWWLVGGLLIGSLIPFTLLVILPTNKALLDPTLDRTSERARQLLVTWGRMHMVRSLVGVATFVLFACLLTFRR